MIFCLLQGNHLEQPFHIRTGLVMTTEAIPNRPRALMVDDNADVLATTGELLEAEGFDVTRAATGEAALACLGSGQTFRLLVTDHAMPGLNGIDFGCWALERFPTLKVLVITGFPVVEPVSAMPSGMALLAKPFRRDALIKQLQVLFDGDKIEKSP
jgi:CheY-like chemotaxis protein